MRFFDYFRHTLLFLIFFVGGTASYAQFNPPNPAEPQVPVFRYPLTTACYPANVAWTSGNGDWEPGSEVWVHSSLYSGNYVFSHWTLNGGYYTDQEGFYYTTTEEPAHFVAHYTFTPSNPEEPTTRLMTRLYLSSLPADVCSFSLTSGVRYDIGSTCYLAAYANQGYRFEGWYDGEKLVSTEQHFYYEIPDHEVSLVAHFSYSPENPVEPDSEQENVDMGDDELPGDIDGDEFIDEWDLRYLVGIILEKEGFEPIRAADVNKNKTINIGDVTKLIEILQQQEE